jgi:hypothetical protein
MTSAGRSYDDLIQKVLDEGMPLALWLRRRTVSLGDAHSEIEKYLIRKDTPLEQLPNVVQEYRSAQTGQGYLGEHLTLLWDDPDRLPPWAWRPVRSPTT